MAPTITLGINSCFAVKRWPDPERWLQIVVDDLELEACQVSLDLFDPGLDPAVTISFARDLERAAAAAGVRLHSTFTGLRAYIGNLLLHPDEVARAASEAWFVRAIELTAALGAGGTGGFVGAFSTADSARPQRRRLLESELLAAMNRLAQQAARHGLGFLLFENMAVEREFGSAIAEAQMLESSLFTAGAATGATPWRLCLDVGHPCALRTGTASDDPLAWLAAPWRHLPVIQVQQANRLGDFHWPFTAERNEEGLVRGDPIIEAIGRWETDEEVFVFLEVIHPAEYPDELVIPELRASAEYWRAALAACPAPSVHVPKPTGSNGN